MSAPSTQAWRGRVPLIVGYVTILLLVGGLGLWSMGTQIAGAVIAQGTVKVELDRQVIQHPDGGVVGAIFVRDGDPVAVGDILVRLDDTFLMSELSIIERQIFEVAARESRHIAERDGLDAVPATSDTGYVTLDEAWMQTQRDGQENLFQARRTSLTAEARQLREQRQQIENQIDGTEAQIGSMQSQLTLVEDELADKTALYDKGLIPIARVLELQREQARLSGELGRLTASVAEARGRIAGIEIGILKLDDTRREEAISRLRDLRYNQIELEQRALALKERLARLDVRAPVGGVIFDSRVLALQSVVQAAEPMMFVVPGDQPLQISAQIDPIHVDQVFPGQPVGLRFTAFDQRQIPEIAGTVLRVSADTVLDQVSGMQVYEATLLPDPESLAAQPTLKILPGMPVEAYLRTQDRTPLSYLTQPLTAYFSRAFRES